MADKKKAKVIQHKEGCQCATCTIESNRQLEARALVTKANIWLMSHVAKMKIFVSDFIKIEVKQTEVKPPVKKRTPRKLKE